MSAKGEYNTLLDLGELFEIYPELTGDWEVDKEEFTEMWEANKTMFDEHKTTYEELGGED